MDFLLSGSLDKGRYWVQAGLAGEFLLEAGKQACGAWHLHKLLFNDMFSLFNEDC